MRLSQLCPERGHFLGAGFKLGNPALGDGVFLHQRLRGLGDTHFKLVLAFFKVGKQSQLLVEFSGQFPGFGKLGIALL